MPTTQQSEFSWSNARHGKLTQCLRLLYLHHYASLGGHLRGADEATRHAYLLKQLVTLEMILGSVSTSMRARLPSQSGINCQFPATIPFSGGRAPA